ncbi:MAG TPA: hypothetical protein VMY78_09140 [Solirubrobacteraceae bacterium]|nr:hypothetical protein [Solirubrobacteraceae bacterium]
MLHPVRHQVNSRVLHKGLFTDEQLMPAAILVLLAVGVAFTAGSVAVASIGGAVFLLPVGAMIIDNRAGQVLHDQVSAWLAYRRNVGVYDAGAGDAAVGYELLADDDVLIAAGAPSPADLRSVLGD